MVGTMIIMAIYAVETVGALTAMQMAAAFAINFAVSMVVTRVFAENPEGQQDMGVRQQVPPSAVNALPVAYGEVYMGGTFIDAILSTDQKCMYYVLAISSISPNGQFTFDTTDMYYGDRKITFDGTDHAKVVSLTDEAGNVNTKIDGRLYIGLYTSNAAGVITPVNWYAPSYVLAETFAGFSIDPALVWPSTGRQMYSTAFAIVRLEYSQEADTTQLQPITFHVKHALNGTGVAKPGDVWYDYITNKYYGGAVGWLPDGSFDSSFVNASSATALNTYSDELITFTGSDGLPKTQARYRINGVLDAGQSVLSNIDRIMSACDSWMTYNAALGQWSVVVNKAESAAYAFNDENIISDIRVSATDITSSINQVEARFPFKENRDQAAFINIATPPALLYPNEPVNKYSITYDLVNESVQSHYLANRLLEQAREDLIVSFNTTYYGIQVNAGDVISVTNSDYGWDAKLFRVMKVNEAAMPDGTLGAKLEMNEYNAQVYDDKDITQFTPVPNSGLSSSAYFSSLTAPLVTSTSPDSAIPNFSVQVYIPITGRVNGIRLYYTTSATPGVSDWQLFNVANAINGTPISANTYYTFDNLVLPTGADTTKVYYFAYVVFNETASSAKSPISSAFTWSPVTPAGPFVDISGFTSFSKSNAGSFTPAFTTLTAITQNITSPTYSWVITGATPTTGSLVDITITPDSSATSIVAELTVDGTNLASPITRSVTMAIVTQGTSAPKYATAYLYQWNTTVPSDPSGTSTYTWLTGASSAYTGSGGWQTSAPTNPGTPLIRLYVASKQVSDVATATTTTVSWTSGFAISDASQNGANGVSGVQNATPTVYQWAASIPTISGTSTYTWASGTFTPTPSGWSTGITTAPSAGYTLWAARVQLTESATVTSSTINWTTASITAAGYSGTNGSAGATGASARVMYARIASNPTPVAGTVTVSGDNRPTGSEASAVWGASFNVTWYASDPDPASNNSLYQSDGVYNGSTSTSWSAPYISSLKVGTLSAITVNTGALTVQNALTISSAGYILGGQTGYNTGTGFFLGYSGGYKFSIGTSTNGLTWDGSNLNISGNSNIQITGNGVFGGAGTTGTLGLGTTAVAANDLNTANFGIITRSSTTAFGSGIYSFSSSGYSLSTCGVFLKQSGGGVTLGTNIVDVSLSLGQIKFPSSPTASTDPNTLDTYAEGSWTPSFTNFGSVSSYTATYTKVGRLVDFTLIINISGAGSSASITRFTLPFNSANAAAFSVYCYNITALGSGGYYQALVDGTNSVQVSYAVNGGGGTFFAGNLINGSQMVISGSYSASS